MAWCVRNDLTQYVLEQYLSAADENTPDIVERSIAGVDAEINEALTAGGYPLSGTSATLTRIAAVLSAWRSVGAITSLVDSEGSTNNEWQPLLHERNRAESELAKIRKGGFDPFPTASAGGMQFDSGQSVFNNSNLEGFF